MTDVEIRPVTPGDDFDAQLDLGERAFGVYPAQQRASWLDGARLRAGQGLFLGAFAGGAPVGAAILHDMRQYWLGNPVGCAGVSAVKVAPEYRGRGIGRRLMTELLHLIASHNSTVADVTGVTAPSDPFWWLTRERGAVVTRRSMWMLRVVDLPAAIAARGFPVAVSASVPLRVTDQARPANAGSWQLTVADGAGTLTPNGGVSSPAPLQLGPRGVAALYAGTPLAALRLAGLASGGSPAADAALDAAFAATPYMLDEF